MKIYLVRHGQSELNQSCEDGGSDVIHNEMLVNLTEKGREQAERAGKALADIVKDKTIRVFTSPYNRAKQTAEIVMNTAGLSGISIKEDDMLIEFRYGLYQSTYTDEERLKKYPGRFKETLETRSKMNRFFTPFYLGDSILDVETRCVNFINRMEIENIKKPVDCVIIVAHGGMIKSFIKAYARLGMQEFENLGFPENCSIQLLENDEYKGFIYGKACIDKID